MSIIGNEDGSFTIGPDLVLETTLGKRDGGGKTLQVRLGDFPPNAVEKILRYGFQRIFNDKVGGSDTKLEDKVIDAQAMIERFKAGNIGRVSVAGVDSVTAEIRAIVRVLLRKKMPKVWGQIKDMERGDANTALDKIFANQPQAKQDEIRAQAELNLETKKAQNEAEEALSVDEVAL